MHQKWASTRPDEIKKRWHGAISNFSVAVDANDNIQGATARVQERSVNDP